MEKKTLYLSKLTRLLENDTFIIYVHTIIEYNVLIILQILIKFQSIKNFVRYFR